MNDQNFLTMCKYKILQKIGEGSYGKVYKVSNKETEDTYAMKKIKVPNLNKKEKKYLINEMAIQKLHTCPFIIKYIDGFFHKKSIYIVSELASNGDLSYLIKNNKKKNIKLSTKKICKYFLQTVLGLNYLHKNNIIHRDIKPSNIFIDKNDNIKIGDLGITTIFEKQSLTKTVVGTPYYMSPELFKNSNYTFKVDIWALGCFLYELITYNPPFLAKNMTQLRYRILYNTSSPINYYHNSHFYQFNKLIYKLLNKSPFGRPNTDSLLNNSFLINYSEIEPKKIILKKDIIKNKLLIPKIPKKTMLWGNIMSQMNKVLLKNETVFSEIEFKKSKNLPPLNIKMKKLESHVKDVDMYNQINTIKKITKLKPIVSKKNITKLKPIVSKKKNIYDNIKISNLKKKILSRIEHKHNRYIYYPKPKQNYKNKFYRNDSNNNLFNYGYKNKYITEYSKYY